MPYERRLVLGNLLVPHKRVQWHLRTLRLADRMPKPLGDYVRIIVGYRLARVWGIHIHPGAKIGAIHVGHPSGIVIGAGAVIEDGVTIYQGVTVGARRKGATGYPVIKTGTILYANAVVIGGVTVGPDARVGANAVVLQNVPPGAIVAGNPARRV